MKMNSEEHWMLIAKALSSNILKPIREETQNCLSLTKVLIRSAAMIGQADVIGGCHMSIESWGGNVPGYDGRRWQHGASEELHPMLGNTDRREDRGRAQLLPKVNLERLDMHFV